MPSDMTIFPQQMNMLKARAELLLYRQTCARQSLQEGMTKHFLVIEIMSDGCKMPPPVMDICCIAPANHVWKLNQGEYCPSRPVSTLERNCGAPALASCRSLHTFPRTPLWPHPASEARPKRSHGHFQVSLPGTSLPVHQGLTDPIRASRNAGGPTASQFKSPKTPPEWSLNATWPSSSNKASPSSSSFSAIVGCATIGSRWDARRSSSTSAVGDCPKIVRSPADAVLHLHAGSQWCPQVIFSYREVVLLHAQDRYAT